tara:strand:+ start:142 stop:759 length:618 start_codon:yes stop_codon:yes gene_type:complete
MANANKSLNLFFLNNTFLNSFKKIEILPKTNLPECCFIGRSNVGKSSMINSITKSKNLSKTSKKPGRTQAINIFEISKKINLVDLPGYGFAKFSKVVRDDLANLVELYIDNRQNLKKIFILIDCKVGIKNADIDFIDYVASVNKQFSIILTKVDKCSLNFMENQKSSIISLMSNYPKNYNKIFLSSCIKNIGILDIQKEIFNLSK